MVVDSEARAQPIRMPQDAVGLLRDRPVLGEGVVSVERDDRSIYRSGNSAAGADFGSGVLPLRSAQ